MEFVTARGWEDLSYLLYTYEKMHLEISQDTIYEYLHHGRKVCYTTEYQSGED